MRQPPLLLYESFMYRFFACRLIKKFASSPKPLKTRGRPRPKIRFAPGYTGYPNIILKISAFSARP